LAGALDASLALTAIGGETLDIQFELSTLGPSLRPWAS